MNRLSSPLMATALVIVSAVPACGDSAPPAAPAGPAPQAELWPTLSCEVLGDHCGLPFPSNVFTAADPGTPTGRRLALSPEMMPRAGSGAAQDPAPFNRGDGFSPGTPILAPLPGATAAGLNGPEDVGASLRDDARTIVLDAETGERVAHWAELDGHFFEGADDRLLIVQPAIRLGDATRYIVAVRGLVDAGGAALAPTEAFLKLRERTPDGTPAVDDRIALYDDIFQRLEGAGWRRDEVQLAWDFTTRSKEDITGWLLSMRDAALAQAGEAGPAFTIDKVTTGAELQALYPEDAANWAPIAYKVEGTFQAPLFLDQPEPGGRLVFGDDGMPVVNPERPTMDVPFQVLIPNSAVSGGPKPLLMFGHGGFSTRKMMEFKYMRRFIDEEGYVMFGVDLLGMAADDAAWLQDTANGPLFPPRLHELVRFHDRLHQGFLNHVLAQRLMKTGFASDPTFGQYVDPGTLRYYGLSLGGEMGIVQVALSQDIERAFLGEAGQPFGALIPRSTQFAPFDIPLRSALVDGRDVNLFIAIAQQTWSRVEADGWSAYVTSNPVDEAAAPKQILLRVSIGDHQVSNWTSHIMARTVGAVHVPSGLRDVWGLEAAAAPYEGPAGYFEYDIGLPPVPPCNVPMTLCADPHITVHSQEDPKEQFREFLRTGRVQNSCEGGVCLLPGLSQCEPGEDEAASLALCPE